MQNTTPHTDVLLMNAEENLNNSNCSNKIFSTTEIPNSPFHIIETDKNVFLALGKYRINRETEEGIPFSKEQYINLVKEKDWLLILDIICIAIELND